MKKEEEEEKWKRIDEVRRKNQIEWRRKLK
jgi:hypothetical protein